MLHLQDLVKQSERTAMVMLNERLPLFFNAPCNLEVTYHVDSKDDYFLINLKVHGELNLICQRCMQEFQYPYDNSTEVAVCRNDKRAEELLEFYECIVAPTLQVSLEELIIDEMHLYAPQFHPDMNDCGSEINQILSSKYDTY